MIVEFRKSFEKDLSKIKDEILLQRIQTVKSDRLLKQRSLF
ncbi:MAG: hypothetical protein RMY34_15485 [Aulosira sp. DedQUE10]|nr:hypothetical protein [Aulosira sp. DedQUE10]